MILYKNIAKLYTLENAYKKEGKNLKLEDLSMITNAAFITDKGKFVWLGKNSKIPKLKITKTIDLKKQNVYPALIDCHTHLIFSGNRSDEFEMRNQGLSYQEIAQRGGGILSTVKNTRKAKLQDLINEGQKRVDELLKQGVTTVEIKSGYGLKYKYEKKILDAALALKKIRVVPTYLGAHAKSPEHQTLDSYLNEIIEKDLVKISKYVKRVDMFVEDGYFQLEHAKKYIEKAKALGMEVTLHAEQLSHTGVTDLAIENQLKSLDHLVYIKDKEIKKLSQSQTTAVLLPSAEKYIHIPYPPARKLLDQGCRVALATDYNPGSAPSQDLSFTGVLARLDLKMLIHEVFAAFTINAAYALGLEDCLGSLSKGKDADFIVSDSEINDFFYGVGFHPVNESYQKGKLVFRRK